MPVRKYEKVFSKKKRIRRYCKIEQITAYNNYPETTREYIRTTKKIFKQFQRMNWDILIRMNWALRRFTYNGKTRGVNWQNKKSNGMCMDVAFGLFVRNFVNHDHRLIFNSNGFYSKLSSYIDNFYPDLLEMDALNTRFEFPYKHIGFEHLVLVYQLDERLELLELGEKKKMPFLTFVDFIIDYCYQKNDELGEPIYDFIVLNHSFSYVKHKGFKEKMMAKFQRKDGK